MTRFLLLTSSIISLFVLSWCLGRLYSPQNCINSTLIGKVVITEGQEAPAELFQRCQFIDRLLQPMPSQWAVQTELLSRMDRLQTVASYLDFQEERINIKVLRGAKNELGFQEQELFISEDLVEKVGVLERAILFMKVNNNQPLTASVIADFLWDTQLAENTSKNFTSPFWLTTLKPISQYCQSDDRLLIHHSFCEAHNELGDSMMVDIDDGPVEWSLKPVLVSILSQVYQKAPLREKQMILENILFLGELGEEFTETLTKTTDFAAANESFRSVINAWLMPILAHESRVSDVVDQFIDIEKSPLSVFVVGRSSRSAFSNVMAPIAVENSKKNEVTENLVFLHGQRMRFLESGIDWRFQRHSFLKAANAENLIYLSCELPEVESLLEYAPVTNRITFVRFCEGDELDWQKISDLGIREYLVKNEKIQFVEFNLAAIGFAHKMRGPLVQHEDFSAWQRWLMWQKIVDDEQGHETSRPLSVIDGVSRFRYF